MSKTIEVLRLLGRLVERILDLFFAVLNRNIKSWGFDDNDKNVKK